MDTLLEDMIAARRAWSSPRLSQWYSAAEREKQLRAALAEQAAWVENEEFGRQYRHDLSNVPVDDPRAWANRRLRLPGEHWCVTGIRFRALDVSKPFVDVVATSLPPTVDSLRSIAVVVVADYAQFAPRTIRVAAPDPDALVAAATGPEHATVDQYIVAGLVSELRRRPRADGFASVHLAAAEPATAARQVSRLYTELAVAEPDLPSWAHPATVEELESSADEQLLFQIRVDTRPAGFVAACRHEDHGLSGFVVVEIVLGRAHRGRRLASAVLQRLVDELPARHGDTLWGTIHRDNQPSLRNARSIGRDVVGGYVWFTPAALPGL